MAPHARRHLDLPREGLVESLGGQAGGHGRLEKTAMQREHIAAACDGELGHCSKTTTRQKKIVPVVDALVKTLYSARHSQAQAARGPIPPPLFKARQLPPRSHREHRTPTLQHSTRLGPGARARGFQQRIRPAVARREPGSLVRHAFAEPRESAR
ncbi:unnamed protein product [Brugia timori]|uniref:Uncharacterized protein n=1 Tax=Brugia timori TaxID=42155 RepID=A0A3P7T842_9BILA|nr:unnamed protein product [Brugia timori]